MNLIPGIFYPNLRKVIVGDAFYLVYNFGGRLRTPLLAPRPRTSDFGVTSSLLKANLILRIGSPQTQLQHERSPGSLFSG